MLFFIDESWQLSDDKQFKAGVLSAIPMASREFNEASLEIWKLKRKHLGLQADALELKGHRMFQRFYFRLEKKGIRSQQLDFARDIFSAAERRGIKVFATVTFAKHDLDLACANPDQLERPFFFLFERINHFMKEQKGDSVAKLIFDDRGVSTNQRISKSVSNFFHKSSVGKSFDKILKVPLFAISGENVGIQLADIFGHIIGRRFTGDRDLTMEFFQRAKALQYESKDEPAKLPDGTPIRMKGIKVIKDRGSKIGDMAEDA